MEDYKFNEVQIREILIGYRWIYRDLFEAIKWPGTFEEAINKKIDFDINHARDEQMPLIAGYVEQEIIELWLEERVKKQWKTDEKVKNDLVFCATEISKELGKWLSLPKVVRDVNELNRLLDEEQDDLLSLLSWNRCIKKWANHKICPFQNTDIYTEVLSYLYWRDDAAGSSSSENWLDEVFF